MEHFAKGQRFEPADDYDRRLLERVHPEDWKNPDPARRYNLVVVGGGPAGLVAAVGAAGLGAKVALVERHLLGGDCLNVGCVPSKALLRCAHLAVKIRTAHRFGIDADCKVDFGRVMARVRSLRAELSHHDSAERLRSLGVDVFLGHGQFSGPDALEVAGTKLHFAKALIATGARAAILPIRGLAEAGCLTNETVFQLRSLPERLAVIGAGPVGCELAQAFARLGSRVSLFESEENILPREDREGAAIVEASLKRDGISIHCGANIVEVKRDGAEKRIGLKDGNHIAVDEILLGVGRKPNVEGLGLELATVECTKAGVKVNDRLQTTNSHIYAAGDVCLTHKFTHAADAAARIVLQNALFAGRRKVSRLIVPWCTYTDPEVAHVGLYEAEAVQQGYAVQTFRQDLRAVDRAALDGETEGFVKVHAASNKIVGATIVARNAGDMIAPIVVAMTNGLGLKELGATIFPYPTQSEAIRKVADAYNRSRLTPRVAKLLRRWLNWTG